MLLTFILSITAYELLQVCSLFIVVNSECIDVSNPTTRTFKTLKDFQANKIAFNPENRTFEGNHVAFANSSINVLQKNSFISYESSYVITLSLENHQISQIEDGAFETLHCVNLLNLRQNKITSISKYTFVGLPSLHELDLGMNNLQDLPDYTFNYTRRLKILNMTRNHLKTVHPESFHALFLLEKLDMSYNNLHKVVPEVFQYFKSLVDLQLGSNQIEYVDLEKWISLSKLKVLDVSNNSLKSIDLSYEFSFSSSLTELYINKNYLTKINDFGLKHYLPSLKIIDIRKNPWICDNLVPVIKTLNDSKISHKGFDETAVFSIGGIACNQSIDVYKNNKSTDLTTEAQVNLPANKVKNSTTSAITNDINSQILKTVNNLHTLSIWFFIIITILIVIDISLRSGCLDIVRHHRHGDNYGEVENISLLRSSTS